MKKYFTLGFLLLLCLSLYGCMHRNEAFFHSQVDSDLSQETWQREVDTSPAQWTQNADHWFQTGDPNVTEENNLNAPVSAAISTMMVKVPDFTNIKANGSFQVQIFGADGHNSVFVYGPNDRVRQVKVQVNDQTLSLAEVPHARNLKPVIIRIGIADLQKLVQQGSGTIEGRQLRSSQLVIRSSGKGNIYLAGNINLQEINQSGQGNVTVLGAYTSGLNISSQGAGGSNVSGHVEIRQIKHTGQGDINVIGAQSRALTILAAGSGKIGINGRVMLKEVQAKDKVRVYVRYAYGDSLYVSAFDRAHVGIAGYMKNAAINASNFSRYDGRYLYADEADVRTSDFSHANVAAVNKVFAAAIGNSSIYFFGSPNILSQFVADNGMVVPIWTNTPAATELSPPAKVKEIYTTHKKRHRYK